MKNLKRKLSIFIFLALLIPAVVYGWGLFSIGSAIGFQVDAVVFDGSNDYMNRGADLTGNADSKVGIISLWIKFNGNDGVASTIFENTSDYCRLAQLATNKIEMTAANSVGAAILTVTSTGTYVASATWHHIAASWNLATPVAHLYIDGANVEAGGSTETDDTIDYTRADHSVGALVGGTQKTHADVAELYINYAEFLDISVAANLEKLRSAAGKPVDLGADGSTPTGTQPIVYFSVRPGDAATVFATNKGSGGNFTITGALAIAATSPSD